MRQYQELYFGESLVRKRQRIQEKLSRGQYPIRLYLVTLPEEGPGQLECFPAALLKQKGFVSEAALLVGVAADQSEAVELVRQITDTVYQETGDVDIRAWLFARSQDAAMSERESDRANIG